MLDRTARGGLLVAAFALLTAPALLAQEDDAHLEGLTQEHAGDSPVPSGATADAPHLAVTSQTVTYATVGEQPVEGYLARPEGVEGPRPGLVVVQEWWGLNDNIRAMTDRLAGEGYVALAVDLYGGRVADDPDTARSLVQEALDHPEQIAENMRQALAWVAANNGGAPVGVIGWCFGGGVTLQTALDNPEAVAAAVMYYGRLVQDRDALAQLQDPLLGHFGTEDASIPVDDVRAFEAALEELGKTAQIYVYDGAGHAFANPSGTHYEEEAASTAWQRTLDFFGEHLDAAPTSAPSE